ncbi:metallophosphoesterase [Propionibacterium sp. oral taxon 192]|uniref:metallophosphoesterase n=1 Tax=Propionibacterium sp. oral taxon 192 TaxID=671222 RepID=UPI0018DC13E3|nr:metallophosphoesterase [Propionibacterium sp. oral taxon 192]
MSSRRGRRIVAVVLLLVAVTVGFFVAGLRNDIIITRYQLGVAGVQSPIRVAVIADTHSCRYDDDQQQIANMVRAENPDVITLVGDIVDDDLSYERGLDTVRHMPEIAPTFYVAGNHEYWSGRAREVKKELSGMGIHVLAGDTEEVDVNGQPLLVSGIDDPDADIYDPQTGNSFDDQAERLRTVSSETPRLLLSHRPERTDLYKSLDVDVIFSGHAHGGQWRIPGLLPNGLYAPNQGFFPKLSRGIHDLGGGRELIISRGLSRESTSIPRLFNPPEILIVDLVPA